MNHMFQPPGMKKDDAGLGLGNATGMGVERVESAECVWQENTAFARSFSMLTSEDGELGVEDVPHIPFLEDACDLGTPFRPTEVVQPAVQLDTSGRDSPAENVPTHHQPKPGFLIPAGPPAPSSPLWRALQNITGEPRDSELKTFMSSMVYEAHGRQNGAINQNICTSSISSLSCPETPREGRTQQEEVFKSFMQLDRQGRRNCALWNDQTMLTIQGIFFRACVRPHCLQDDRLSRLKLQHAVKKSAGCAILLLFTVFYVCGQLADDLFDSASVPLVLRVVGDAGIPCCLYVLKKQLESLHVWLSAAMLAHWVASALLPNLGSHCAASGCRGPALLPVVMAVAAAGLSEAERVLAGRRAARGVEGDKAGYDAAWEEVLGKEEERQALGRVEKLCEHYRGWGPVRQCLGVGLQGAEVGVDSLDQLFQQSMALQPILRTSAQHWAMRSNGWFRLKPVPGEEEEAGVKMLRWNDAKEEDVERVAWASSKSFARALVKVERKQWKVARLTDMTRESIFFDSMADLEACLMAISWDRWATILKIHNALAPSAGSHATGGFRFVKLLLRLTAPAAEEIGVDGHVCELLLVPKALEESKTPGWHARFVAWKDKRPRSLRRRLLPPRLAAAAIRRRPGPGPAPFRTSSMGSEAARSFSVEEAAAEVQRRRAAPQPVSQRGMERDALLAECAQAMKAYLWGINSSLYGRVGRKTRDVDAATSSSTFAACFRMRQPLESVLCRGLAQALVLASGAAMLFLGAADMRAITSPPALAARHFRFTNLEPRDPAAPPAPCIGSLEPLLRGEPTDALLRWQSVRASSLTVSFAAAVRFDGWGFTTAADPSCAPVRFMLEVRDEEAGAWRVAGSSTRFKEAGRAAVFEHGVFDTPPEAGVPVRFDLGDAPYALLLPLGGLLVGVTMVAAGVLGWWRRPAAAAALVKGMAAVQVLPHLVAMWLMVGDEHAREALVVASWAASSVASTALVHLRPNRLPEAFILAGGILLLATCALRVSMYEVCSGADLVDPVAVLYIALGGGCKALVLYNDWQCERSFLRDAGLYHAVWDKICSSDANGTLDKIKFCAEQMQACAVWDATQRAVPFPASLDLDAEMGSAAWWADVALSHSEELYARSPPVESLDQLYAQAEVASVVMRHKLKLWAVGSHGLFLRKQNQEEGASPRRQWARAAELLRGEEEDIQWGPLKRESRAVEKAFRCYGGEVARLLDLSRHALVFEEPEHLLQCLEILRADPDVRLLRVKNELHPDAPSASGYRQVLVNIMVVTQETERMGTSMHVSELQLLPLGFALAKTDDGHRRYVEMRNARGE